MPTLAGRTAYILSAVSCILQPPLFAQSGTESGELDRRLKAHAQLFTLQDFGKPVNATQANAHSEVEITADVINDYAQMPLLSTSPNELAQHELDLITSASRVVILAQAESYRSAFTPRRAFIYSDWDFRVLRVIKNDSPVSTSLGDVVTVTRPGGRVVRDAVSYIAHDKTFPSFVQGSTYLLFLSALPASHSFEAFSGVSFLLSNIGVTSLSDDQDPSTIPTWLKGLIEKEFMNAIDTSVVRTIKQQWTR